MKYNFFSRRNTINHSSLKTSKSVLILTITSTIITLSSCKKLIEIDAPVTSTNEQIVFETDAMAVSVMTGVYANMVDLIFSGNNGVSIYGGLSADEFTLWPGVNNANLVALYKNNLVQNSTNQYGSDHWSLIYKLIYNCNATVHGLSISNKISAGVKSQLMGEAKFTRAFLYFYLVNFFGEVPLVLETDYQRNSNKGKSSVAEIYNQLITDLKDAEETLSENYVDATLTNQSMERVRPTRSAAAALLARIYLYNENWALAEQEASRVILQSNKYKLPIDINTTFIKNSDEAIWQLQPVTFGRNSDDGRTFIIPATGPSDVNGENGNPVYLSQSLLNSFEEGDIRKKKWIDSVIVGSTTYYYPFKYKTSEFTTDITEYQMMIRLSEIYLIRAEALAQQGKLENAKDDLDEIRLKAGLNPTTASTKQEVLSAIIHERRVELFTELAHRWFDLKRNRIVDEVMKNAAEYKGTSWKPFQKLYPIPFNDIQRDPNLDQNTGY